MLAMEGVLTMKEPMSNDDEGSATIRPLVDGAAFEEENDRGETLCDPAPDSADACEEPAQSCGGDDASLDSLAANEAPVEIHPHRVVEAVLFAADSPMPPAKIAALMGVGDARDVRKHIEKLNEEYASHGLSFRIQEVAGGFQMLTVPAYNPWLKKLLRVRQETRLSPAALETLAILAYKQPCTRADVEAIRGVAAGELINRLRELNLVKIVGRAEDLGRPLLYGTTKRFLEVFGLPSLEELPQVEALSGGNAPGMVRDSATMPAAALANGPVESQHAAEKTLEVTPVPVEMAAEARPTLRSANSATPVAASNSDEVEQT